VLVEGPAGSYDVPLQPYSNVQFAIPRQELVLIFVLSGPVQVSAYLSQVDNESGDAVFIPATPSPDDARIKIAPVVNQAGWRSEVRLLATRPAAFVEGTLFADGETSTRIFDAPAVGTLSVLGNELPFGALRLRLPPGVIADSRVTRDGVAQHIPFIEPDGPAEQHLVFIESSAAYRTNIGIVADEAAMAQVTVYDSAGLEIERRTLATAGGAAQARVGVPVVAGRAVVRFVAGRGRAYASLIDNRTQDATFVPAQP